MREITCPQCGVEIEEQGGKFVIGKARVHPVPRLIMTDTSRVAEQLRALADRMESGQLDGISAGVVIMLQADALGAVTKAPLGAPLNIKPQQIQAVLDFALKHATHGAVRLAA